MRGAKGSILDRYANGLSHAGFSLCADAHSISGRNEATGCHEKGPRTQAAGGRNPPTNHQGGRVNWREGRDKLSTSVRGISVRKRTEGAGLFDTGIKRNSGLGCAVREGLADTCGDDKRPCANRMGLAILDAAFLKFLCAMAYRLCTARGSECPFNVRVPTGWHINHSRESG